MNKVESAPSELAFGAFRLDPLARRLRRLDGSEVELGPRLFDALLFFAERPGVLLDKDVLLAALWPGLVVEENNVNQLVLGLRRALGDEAQASRYIQTVPRRGFRFIAGVTREPRSVEPIAAPATGRPTEAAPSAPSRAARAGWRRPWSAALLAALLLGALAWLAWPTPPPAGGTTLAVLPFKPLARERRDDALELGMADSLIVRMSALPGVVVRSVGSVSRFAGPDQDPLRAARELDVQWILDGSVQRWGERVRVSARLLRAADGVAVWSGSFDDDFKDVFGVQDRISERVAGVLAPRLSAADRSRLAFSGTRNPDAYQLYLTARYQTQGIRADGLLKSIELYRRATEIDPGYALAYAGLSAAWRRLAIGGDALPAQTFGPAQQAAEHALRLDPMLADAHAALGWVRWWYGWDWAGAEHSFRRAIELNPNVAEAQLGLGHLLCSQGRCHEGFDHVRRARELDPLSLITNVIEASYLLQRGRPDEAQARVERALQIEPGFWPAYQFLAGLHVSAGDWAAAEQSLRRAEQLARGSVQPSANLGVVLAHRGRTAEARAIVERLLALRPTHYVPPSFIASLYCALGERAEALDWLERGRAVHDIYLPFFGECSPLLHDEPRFRALRESIGLPPTEDLVCAPLQAPAVACRPAALGGTPPQPSARSVSSSR